MILDFNRDGVPPASPTSPARSFMESSDTKEKEKPPPYTSGSQKGHLPPPPPRRSPEASGSSMKALPVPTAPSPTSPPPTVNQLHLETGANPISGIFYVDPKIPSLGFNAKGFKAYKKNPPHASFRTKQGTISLELAPTGELSEAIPKANVLVASRSGNIDVKLLPTSSARPRIGLEVISKTGDIVVFLPQNFAGAIQISTRKGKIEFLPSFARAMKVLKQNEREAFVMLGEKSSPGREVDFCQLNSRTGKLVIGFADLDKHEAKPGFWRTLGQMFGGE